MCFVLACLCSMTGLGILGLQMQVGLQPDLVCVPEVTQAEYWVAGSRDSEDLSQDPCIQMAQEKLSSMQPKGEGQ